MNATATTIATLTPPPNNLTPRRRAETRRRIGALFPLLAALLIAQSVMTPRSATAQVSNDCLTAAESQETVCNRDESVTIVGETGYAASASANQQFANSFTTGSAASAYRLQTVRISTNGRTGNPGDIVVAIHAETETGGVGAQLTTLSGESPVGVGSYDFTADGFSLDAETQYYLVVSAPDAPTSGNNIYNINMTTSTAQTGDAGWAIGDRVYQSDDNGPFTVIDRDLAFSFSLVADVEASGSPAATTDSGAAIARAITGIANNAIASRIAQARHGDGGGNNFNFAQTTSRILAAPDGDLGDGVKAILDGKVFAWSAKSSGGGSTPSFWASGDYVDISGDENAAEWDGDVISLQLGADTRMANGNLIGAAISHSESDIDYTDGEQQLTLTALHPYIGWRAANTNADLWASLAYGTGDLERKVGDDTTTNDATLIGGAFGAAVSIGDNARMHAKIETARLTLDNAAEDGDDLEVDAHRARFGAEWSHTTRRGDATIRRALTGGARYDGGDGITGVAAEVGGSIGYDNGNGTAITARLWTLAAHDADYDEWGAGATVQHASGADGQGFALRIEPSWGATQSRADELLNGDDALTDRAFDSSARMDGEIGYGIAYNEGMMIPYSGFRFTSDSRTYRIGTRYKLRPIPLEMGLEAYRKQRADIENGVLLKASIRW